MKILVLTIFILIALVYNVNALAVASDFLENDTIVLIEGASRLYGIRIQNPSQQEIRVKLTYDEAILKVIDYQDEYIIPPETNYPVLFNVSTPKNAKPNQIYTVSYTIHQLAGSGSGLPILIKIAKNFKLKITKDPNKFYISDYYPYIPNVVIILIIIFVLFRKDWIRKKFMKKETSKKKTKKIIKNRKIIKKKR